MKSINTEYNRTLELPQSVLDMAPLIMQEINSAQNILLHCHPSPDPDSVGSALAMSFALRKLGKDVSVISGDSRIPQAYMHFPGAKEIIPQKFFEVDFSKYDLFISLDSATTKNISKINPPNIPLPIRTISIDHHQTNGMFGDINLVLPEYPATGQLVFDLLHAVGVEMDRNIAENLFIAIYTDTLGFQTPNTTPRTIKICAELAELIPNLKNLISLTENSNTPEFIRFQALALSSIRTFHDGKIALSVISSGALKENNINPEEMKTGLISPILNSVVDWKIVAVILEEEKDMLRFSFRTRDEKNYDVTKIAGIFGGGGHKGASGASTSMQLEDAVRLLVDKAHELYNL